jgi:hypothetical protein
MGLTAWTAVNRAVRMYFLFIFLLTNTKWGRKEREKFAYRNEILLKSNGIPISRINRKGSASTKS